MYLLLLVATAALVAVWVVARHWKYSQSVRYNAGRGHRYDLKGRDVGGVQIRDGEIVVPKLANGGTVVVAIHVEASSLGSIYDPCVEIWGQEHWMERGAHGTRFLNLSDVPAGRHPVTENFCRLPDQDCPAVHFPAAISGDDRLMVLAPHPDDAEIAAFGLTRSAAEMAMIVTVTPGDNTLRYEPACGSHADASMLAARVRAFDASVAGLWSGVPVSRSVVLGYPDSKLSEMRKRSAVGAESIHGAFSSPADFRPLWLQRERDVKDAKWDELVADLRFLLERHETSVIAAPHPLLESHDDHVLSTLALCEALLQAPAIPAKLLLYVNHHILSEVYPFGEAGSAVDLPPLLESAPGCDQVYSHYLDQSTQIDKVIALDDHHALRPNPLPWRRGVFTKEIVDRLRRFFLGSHRYDFNYFRRAVRQHELFFVIEPDKLAELQRMIVLSLRD